jgi:hypothetical protein
MLEIFNLLFFYLFIFMKYQTIIDDTTTADITYICRAELGRNETSPLWQIIAIDETGSQVKVKYPRRAD